jgi:glycosyl transferase family 25
MSLIEDCAGLAGAEPQTWGTGLMNNIVFVGLDVHKATITTRRAQRLARHQHQARGIMQYRVQESGRSTGTAFGSKNLTWPVYVISLAGAMQRRAACKRVLDLIGLSFEFFDAIDGVRLSEDEVAAAYDALRNSRQYKRPLSLPEIGCYLSHYALWRRIVEQNLSGAVILEDDFDADENLKQVVEAIQSAAPSGAMVKLFSRKPVTGVTVAMLQGERRLLAPDRVPGLTLGYALDCTAAETLLVNALPFARPLDMDIKHWWEFSLPVLLVDPPPLRISELSLGSSITPARVAAAAEANVSAVNRLVANLRYQLDYNVQLLRARGDGRRAVSRLREQLRRRDEINAAFTTRCSGAER